MSKEKVEKILDTIYDPEFGESILKSGMVKKVEIKKKLVKVWIRPISSACAGCFILNAIISEIENKLEKEGFEVEVQFDFDEE